MGVGGLFRGWPSPQVSNDQVTPKREDIATSEHFRPAAGKRSKTWASDCYVYERLERFMRIKHDARSG
ncbi:MAG: hypothetical protein ACRDK3_03190, partial [Actinomycetota bacterium]